jgi:mannitol-1-phosphate 5-dehydrogenase
MSQINSKKIVIFGAGKIGRSFIGQLFSRGGYEVVFIDINKSLIDELNRRHNYNVIIKAEKEEVINIRNARGLVSDNREAVAEEVATSGILAVSVGQEGLSGTFPLIAAGLIKRYESDFNSPLDIIIAENIRNGARYFKKELKKLLPEGFPVRDYVGLIETSIGKMVPIMLKKDMEQDMLQVFAEPYNTLILNKKGFKNNIPDIPGLSPKKNIRAWVDRKLFIHNLGHASAAYAGHLFNPEFTYVYEALAVPEIHRLVRETMLQSANLLLIRYPDDFTRSMLTDHIDDLLSRFQNKALGDTIFRVGCDLFRKLGPEDRLAGSIKMALDLNQPYDRIFLSYCALSGSGVQTKKANCFREMLNLLNYSTGILKAFFQKFVLLTI